MRPRTGGARILRLADKTGKISGVLSLRERVERQISSGWGRLIFRRSPVWGSRGSAMGSAWEPGSMAEGNMGVYVVSTARKEAQNVRWWPYTYHRSYPYTQRASPYTQPPFPDADPSADRSGVPQTRHEQNGYDQSTTSTQTNTNAARLGCEHHTSLTHYPRRWLRSDPLLLGEKEAEEKPPGHGHKSRDLPAGFHAPKSTHSVNRRHTRR